MTRLRFFGIQQDWFWPGEPNFLLPTENGCKASRMNISLLARTWIGMEPSGEVLNTLERVPSLGLLKIPTEATVVWAAISALPTIREAPLTPKEWAIGLTAIFLNTPLLV